MGCEMSQANPFIPSGREYGAVDTESRLRALEDFDLEQCRAALALPGLQKTVEKKLRSRIRALEKLATAAGQAEGAHGSPCVETYHEVANRAMWHTNCPDGRLGSPMKPTANGWMCVVCGAISPYPTQGGA